MSRSANLSDVVGDVDGEGYLGLGYHRDLATLAADIAIIGMASATPYPSAGPYCADGPETLRQASLLDASNIRNLDFNLEGPVLPETVSAVDCGDLAFDERDFAANRQNSQRSIETVLNRGAVPIVIGGDDSIPIPVAAAYAAAGPSTLTIFQVDAHIDWRDEVRGERWGLSSPMRRMSEMAHVGTMVQVGRRGVGSARQADYDAAIRRGVTFVSAREVDQTGVSRAIDAVPANSDVLFCFDVDGLDPSIMPSVIGRAPGGLTYWNAIDLIAGVAARARIAGFVLSEFLPGNDIGGLGANCATNLLSFTLGTIARQISQARG